MTLQPNSDWAFGEGGGDAQGFNEGAIDIFQGHGLQSLVREVIQNSSDARDLNTSPAEIAFSLSTVAPENALIFHRLSQWLKRAWNAAPPQQGDDDLALGRHSFYQNALKRLTPGMAVPILSIHDFNTTGLTGPTKYSAQPESWWKLVRSTGSSLKTNAGAAGSFGHGSKAPFAFSGARTVFYFTHFGIDGSECRRFQGKAILESMPHPDSPDRFTSNTGYFGFSGAGGSEPLIDDQIPQWILDDRKKFGEEFGTSIVIVLPQLETEEKFWHDVKVAVTTNFSPAVLEDRIRIHLGEGETITSDTIRSVFRSIEKTVLSDIPRSRMESAETVLFGTRDRRTFQDFGEVDLYSRTGEGLSTRKVGIAREAGMLITRDAEKLKAQFGSVEPFDLFVWVREGSGNLLLRSLENPAHDAFEFDRIRDPQKQKEARKQYENFAKEVRQYISDSFGIQVQEHLALSDLDFLLSDESLGNGGPPDAEGADVPTVSPIQKPVSPANSKKKKDGPKAVAVMRGRKPPQGRTGSLEGEGADVEANESLAENFRIVPSATNESKATVYFDAPEPEFRYLEIYRAGETSIADRPCRIRTSSNPSFTNHVPLDDGKRPKRIQIELFFEYGDDLNGGSRLIGIVR